MTPKIIVDVIEKESPNGANNYSSSRQNDKHVENDYIDQNSDNNEHRVSSRTITKMAFK